MSEMSITARIVLAGVVAGAAGALAVSMGAPGIPAIIGTLALLGFLVLL